MPAHAQATARTDLEIDRVTHTIRLARVFDAPRAEIFDAWTQPKHVACWWDAGGQPLLSCEIDLRPGGAFKFVSKSGPDMPFSGTYRDIAPPDRLVFDVMGATGRVLLQTVVGKTHMTVEITCSSAEHLDQYLAMGVDVGTAQTLDNLVAYARKRSALVG